MRGVWKRGGWKKVLSNAGADVIVRGIGNSIELSSRDAGVAKESGLSHFLI